MQTAEVTLSLYKNSVPPFVEAELEKLYGHIYSSLPQFSVYGSIGDDTHTYIAREQGKTCAALLFRINRARAQVLNEQISIDTKEVERFARHVFDTFPSVNVIVFRAVHTPSRQIAFPHQSINCTEDIVLELPRTAEAYLGNLSKTTRRNIKYYANRLKRNFPTLGYSVRVGDAINPEQVHAIAALNKLRMAAKNKVSEADDEEIARLCRLVQRQGMVCVMTIDGQVVAGTVCSQVGTNYFMHMIAHDPAYDDARIGNLCCYLTICDCIARGGKEFHFLWGRFDYKYMLRGVQRNFDELTIYRSGRHFLLHSGSALSIAFRGWLRTTKFRLLDMAGQQQEAGFTMRALSRLLISLRNLKRSFVLPAQRH